MEAALRLDPWTVKPEDFPLGGTDADKLAFGLRYAILAPSSHNTQPWTFRLHGHSVELRLDRSRALPMLDPDGREMIMSCGAALMHLRIALEAHGQQVAVQRLPSAEDRDLIARVAIEGERSPSDATVELMPAIFQRRTNRGDYRLDPVPTGVRDRLIDAVTDEDARLTLITPGETHGGVAALVELGSERQWTNPRFRHEAGAFHQGEARAPSDDARVLPATAAEVQTAVARDHEQARQAPTLAVVATQADDRHAWLRSGEALDRLMLAVAAAGAACSFLNQPIEVADLRPELARLAGSADYPQAMLRIGYAEQVPTTRRRVLEDALI